MESNDNTSSNTLSQAGGERGPSKKIASLIQALIAYFSFLSIRELIGITIVITLSIGLVVFYTFPPSAFDGEIILKIEEQFTPAFDGPHIFLILRTKDSFPCFNYGLEHRSVVSGDSVDIYLGKIIKPELCLTLVGPATFEVDFGSIIGVHTLKFHSKNGTDQYTMTISENNIMVEEVESTFSSVEYSNDKRLPKNLLMATCFYNDDWRFNPRDDFCEKFFDDIKKISQPYMVAEGRATPQSQFYIYEGGDENLRDLIKTYNRQEYYVRFMTYEGKSFICPRNCESPGLAYVPELMLEYIFEPRTTLEECSRQDVVCKIEVAFYSKNDGICESLSEENHEQCFADVGIATLNAELCNKARKHFYSSAERECFSYIAIQKNQPSVCDHIDQGADRDNCYISYVFATGNKSLCKEVAVLRLRDKCLSRE